MSEQTGLLGKAWRLSRRWRHAALTVHIVTSVAWIGMNVCLLLLAIAGLNARDPEQLRAVQFGMTVIGTPLILPISFGAFLSGVVLSLGTPWGLFQYYWVVAKLVMTLALLFGHQGLRTYLTTLTIQLQTGVNPPAEGTPLIGMLCGTLVVLLAATILSVFKPWRRLPIRSRI